MIANADGTTDSKSLLQRTLDELSGNLATHDDTIAELLKRTSRIRVPEPPVSTTTESGDNAQLPVSELTAVIQDFNLRVTRQTAQLQQITRELDL